MIKNGDLEHVQRLIACLGVQHYGYCPTVMSGLEARGRVCHGKKGSCKSNILFWLLWANSLFWLLCRTGHLPAELLFGTGQTLLCNPINGYFLTVLFDAMWKKHGKATAICGTVSLYEVDLIRWKSVSPCAVTPAGYSLLARRCRHMHLLADESYVSSFTGSDASAALASAVLLQLA